MRPRAAGLTGALDEAGLLIRGSLARVLAYAASSLLAVLSTAVITRHLGVSTFGQYATVISVSTLVATVTDAGMTSIANRDYAVLDGERREALLGSLLGLRMFLTVIGTAFAIGFALVAHYDTALVLGMLVASMSTFPLIVYHTLSVPLTNELRLGTLALLEFARQAVWVAAVVTLAALGAGVVALLATMVLANLLMVPAAMRATRGGRISLRMRRSGWRALVGRTVAFSVATATGTVYLYGTQMMTALVTNHYQTGLFAVSFRVFIVLGAVPALVAAGTVPVLARASQNDDGQLAYVLRRYLETSLIGGIALALFISAGSGLIIGLVAGARFHGAVAVLELQAFAMIATFTASACGFGLLALHLYRRLLVANATALVVMIVATVLLAGRYGAQGAAAASICGEATVAALMLAGILRARRECHPGKRFAVKLCLASACAAPLVIERWLASPVRAVAVAAVYAGVVLATRALPGEVLDALPLRRRPAGTGSG